MLFEIEVEDEKNLVELADFFQKAETNNVSQFSLITFLATEFTYFIQIKTSGKNYF